MAFEDLKERAKEQVAQIVSRIQESSAWAQIMEKYQDLSPNGQKLALFGTGALLALILLLLPYTFYSSSETSLEDFEARKELIRELYRVSHDVSALPPAPRNVDASDLRSTAQLTASRERLQPDQSGPIADFDNLSEKPGFRPKGLTQKGVTATYTKLNLEQILNIGRQLQQSAPTAKMTGLRIQATPEDPHYFNVTYKLVAFNLPPEPIAKKAPARGRGRSASDEE